MFVIRSYEGFISSNDIFPIKVVNYSNDTNQVYALELNYQILTFHDEEMRDQALSKVFQKIHQSQERTNDQFDIIDLMDSQLIYKDEAGKYSIKAHFTQDLTFAFPSKEERDKQPDITEGLDSTRWYRLPDNELSEEQKKNLVEQLTLQALSQQQPVVKNEPEQEVAE